MKTSMIAKKTEDGSSSQALIPEKVTFTLLFVFLECILPLRKNNNSDKPKAKTRQKNFEND